MYWNTQLFNKMEQLDDNSDFSLDALISSLSMVDIQTSETVTFDSDSWALFYLL